MESLWCVYVHENIFNGKRYVGVTSKSKPEHRWNGGRGYKENPHFYSAILKYGWDSFEHIILYRNLCEEAAKDIERSLIRIWGTQDPSRGYNMTSGGDGTPDYHPSNETIMKLSIARRKENLSPETLARRSAALKGRVFSDEHKRKIGDANSKSVTQLSKDGTPIRTFRSLAEAEASTGISHSHISQCCNGTRNSSGGFCWAYA